MIVPDREIIQYESIKAKRCLACLRRSQRGKSDGGRVYEGQSSKCEIKEIKGLFFGGGFI